VGETKIGVTSSRRAAGCLMRAQPYRSKRSDPTVDAAVAEHGRVEDAALPVLQAAQAADRSFLSKNVLGAVADALQLADARVYGVASFYSLLSTRPRAAKIIRVCDGPVCTLQGAASVRASIEAANAGGEWAVERCSCLGLCDRAPAALRAGEPCGPIPPDGGADVLSGGPCGAMPSYAEPRPGEVRVALGRIGRVDPESVESAIEA